MAIPLPCRFSRIAHVWACAFAASTLLLLSACVDKQEQPSLTTQQLAFLVDPQSLSKWSNGNARTATEESDGELRGVVQLRGGNDPLYLHVYERPYLPTSTRASELTLTGMSNFGVHIYRHTAPWDESLTPDFAYNLEVTKASNWSTQLYWPAGGKLSFFAYHPYSPLPEGMTLSSNTHQGSPKIYYTVPGGGINTSQIWKKHRDIVVATQKNIDSNGATGPIPITFQHILSAIKFKASANTRPGKILHIEIKNILNQATYTMGQGWSGQTKVANENQILHWAYGGKDVGGGTEVDLSGTAAILMLLPQALPNDAVIEITYTSNGQTEVLSVDLEALSSVWQPGKAYTYVINRSII